jgi:hypothetical protein
VSVPCFAPYKESDRLGSSSSVEEMDDANPQLAMNRFMIEFEDRLAQYI